MKTALSILSLLTITFVLCACEDTETSTERSSLNSGGEQVTAQAEVGEGEETRAGGEGDAGAEAHEGGSSSPEGGAAQAALGGAGAGEEALTLEVAPLDERGEVVADVDVDRYMGTWFEIATTPSIQQRVCYGTQAVYEFNEAQGWVDVLNRCNAGGPDGRLQEIMGRAEIDDPEAPSKLTVYFFDQGSPYWVVALDGSAGEEPYQWAVVSVPGQQFIWILSRTPQMDDELRAELNEHLIERGFTIERLIETPQGGAEMP